jgi:putative ABC transport system ATP-binding protein
VTALHLTDVRKVYPSGDEEVVALDHAELRVESGELVALIGPSGSGKSTLLSIAGGLLQPTQGRVEVGGEDISRLDPRRLTSFRREHIGFVFQAVNLVPFLSAIENVLLVPDLSGAADRPVRDRADQLLSELGLDHRRGARSEKLSGGERQRVAIARALVFQPEVVLFDEPTSALDTHLGEQVMELIQREVHERGVAGVVVTHDPRMTHYCDRVVEITDGVLRAA